MKIGLVSHLIRDYNLGCSALAISNIKLMDEVLAQYNVEAEYVIILPEPREKMDLEKFTSLEGFTENKFSYKTYPRPKNLLKKPWLIYKTDAFKGLDVLIDLCGGDGYTDNYGVPRIILESIPIIGAAIHHVKTVFAPQTIGPFNTKIGTFMAEYTMRKLNTIYVRDEKSFECCCNLGMKSKTVQVIDVAFALPYKQNKINNNNFNIGINVSGLLYNGGYDGNNFFDLSFDYKEFVLELIGKLTSIKNVQVHLIPHVIDVKRSVDDDWSACVEIRKIYPDCILPEKFESATEAKSYISGLDLFSGARMHSTIGATSSGVPVIPIAYSRKFNGLFDTLHYPYYIDAKSNISLNEALNEFFDYMDRIDDLRNGIKEAQQIYQRELDKYKKNLPITLGLEEKKKSEKL